MRLIDLFRKQVPATDEVGLEPRPQARRKRAVLTPWSPGRLSGRTCRFGHEDATAAAGLPVKVMGAPDLKSHDTRRWASKPHLKVSLEYLARIFDYLQHHRIDLYRMSSDLAPYATHPDMPQFHEMIAESAGELARSAGRPASSISGCPFIPRCSSC